ncbi:hypothetical protein BKA63DRAFT_80042 [Paraphoma chrysanthemicola]|nr:hypothetical protein BKA63DRAFT_80042 [Paraphoma chrysanthemicola]
MDVDLVDQGSGQSCPNSQINVINQHSRLMDEDSRSLDGPILSPPSQDHCDDLIQSSSAGAAQTEFLYAASECNNSTITGTSSAPNVSPTRPSSHPSTVGHIQFCTETRSLVFRCVHPRCRDRPFRRPFEFERHYNSIHAAVKTIFWCPSAGCNRGTGKRPFPRKDKMMDHARKVHGIEVGNKENEMVE